MAPYNYNISLMHILPDNNMAKSGDQITVSSVWYSTGIADYLAGGKVDEARGWPLTAMYCHVRLHGVYMPIQMAQVANVCLDKTQDM